MDRVVFRGRCLLTVAMVSCILAAVVEGNLWKKSLEKELIHHSITYLREQLFVCLKSGDIVRRKRMVNFDAVFWLAEMELQMDIDLLKNSQTYLMDRVIHCRRRTESRMNRLLPDHADDILIAKVERYMMPKAAAMHAPANNDIPDSYAYDYGMDVPDADLATPEPTTETVTKPSTTTTTTPVPTSPQPEMEFEVDGKSLTCDRFVAERTTLVCLNLRVDMDDRLPNKDFCPPVYTPDRWRPVEDMPTATHKVLDLLNLCSVIGKQLQVPGYLKDTQVVWGCGEIKPRLKWLNGGWSGTTLDNGFLHDLMCQYSADIDLSTTP